METVKRIAFATDHTAIQIRETIKNYLKDLGYEVLDFDFCGGSCDYPDYALKVAKAVANNEAYKGVLICGTGIGMSIAANKVKSVIAAVCWNEDTARLVAEHNCANIVCLGSRTATVSQICHRIKIFLETPFEERHSKRIEKIKQIEKMESC
ncbi:MAG: ribose 5-phosphate isomerase B [Endomicrobium sp.]|jgi:ribose 5-phosphate isomerase B|nr:ribose 5-phosphate isomerase B [Endomicrobium sp.]